MAALQEYKCPCCGGAIEFNSSVQKMKCPYCDTEFEMEALAAYDEELSNDTDSKLDWNTDTVDSWTTDEATGLKSFICESCGGQILAEDETVAASCPYCGNPIVVMGNVAGELKPKYVIPFKLDKQAAKEKFAEHLTGKRFLPRVFKSQTHIDEIKGIYVPYWVFVSEADANVRYKATKVRTWSDRKFNYTETSYYSVTRAGSLDFSHVPVDGSTRMEDDMMESLEPFNFDDAVDFQTAYLAGYLADKYDVDAETASSRANERVMNSTEQTFRNTVEGYATVETEHTNIQLKNGEVTYVMYPVWILNTTWNGEKYVFAMNGQTGKFVGNLPVDKSIATKWLLGLGFGIAAAVYVLSYLVWLM